MALFNSDITRWVIRVVWLATLTCCQPSLEEKSWNLDLKKLGTNSSPRLADLNKDGVLDIVLGSGAAERQWCDSAVLAINGSNGQLLWEASARDQIVGSAVFLDITHDGVPEIFIGGRQAELIAIHGATGKILWEYFPQGDTIPAESQHLFNFYNPQLVPDLDQDGLEDLLISNGGNVFATPRNERFREPGKLMLIGSAEGRLIAEDEMPDGKETYMSVVVHDFQQKGELSIIFGTGGETIGGKLFKTTMRDLLNGDISGASVILEEKEKGFIAPPVLADITQDGVADIVVNTYRGKMYAIDGNDLSELWSVEIPFSEVYSSVAVGYFTGDAVPDFFASFTKGTFPHFNNAVQLMVDGKEGTIVFSDSRGCFHYSSPLAYDFNQDSYDDVLLHINDYNCYSKNYNAVTNKLLVFDFHNDTTYQIGPTLYSKNPSSTPWIGDIDGDRRLDIIYCMMKNTLKFDEYDGLRVSRLSTDITFSPPISWSGYMGGDYDGIFKNHH